MSEVAPLDIVEAIRQALLRARSRPDGPACAPFRWRHIQNYAKGCSSHKEGLQ